MDRMRISHVSSRVLMMLSVVALLTVLSGYFQAPQADEGTAAHIFKLSIAAFVPTLLLFLSTADWKQARQSWLRLAFPASALVIAFAALYYLEHVWYVRH